MKRSVILRPEAARDIANIADYTIRRWGRKQAQRYVSELRRTIQELSSTGLRHPLVDALHPGLRRVRCRHHLVFYLISDNTIDVVRVLHERMDGHRQLLTL